MMVTDREIDAARTPGGGWTRETLEGWGVSWPPPKGWRKALATPTLSTGQSSTLGVWRANTAAMLGEDSAAVAFLDRKIEQQGADMAVLADERQTIQALLSIHAQYPRPDHREEPGAWPSVNRI